MARKRSSTARRKTDWRTTVWYVIGAVIVILMVFSLFAGALGR